MAEININYTSEALKAGGSSSATWVNIEKIPFTESKINKNDWTAKGCANSRYNYGILIKKDPIIIESNSLLIENTPVLYSFNNNLERINGVHSNYSAKFFVYPCLDFSFANSYISISTLKEMAKLESSTNSVNLISSLYDLPSSGYKIPSAGITTILGSGLECIQSDGSSSYYEQYRVHAAYDIDINNLGINLPSNADRGINEETLQLFDKNNAIDYRDQRLLNKAAEISYYYNFERILSIASIPQDSENVILKTAIKDFIQPWSKTSTSNNALNTEKCMPYAFSNIICHYYGGDATCYNIILMGVKKVEGV